MVDVCACGFVANSDMCCTFDTDSIECLFGKIGSESSRQAHQIAACPKYLGLCLIPFRILCLSLSVYLILSDNDDEQGHGRWSANVISNELHIIRQAKCIIASVALSVSHFRLLNRFRWWWRVRIRACNTRIWSWIIPSPVFGFENPYYLRTSHGHIKCTKNKYRNTHQKRECNWKWDRNETERWIVVVT